jgi:hypothetical protein
MTGLGKQRSKLGRWLDQRGISQEWVRGKSKLGRNTVSKVCSDPDYTPTGSTMRKILNALRQIDPNVRADKFWDM